MWVFTIRVAGSPGALLTPGRRWTIFWTPIRRRIPDSQSHVRATSRPIKKPSSPSFFIGREVAPTWIWLSGILRRIGIQKIVHLLPGVSRDPGDPANLIVNTHIASLFPLQIFHLLGFRRRRWSNNKLVVSRRKHDTDGPFRWEGIQMGRNITDGR